MYPGTKLFLSFLGWGVWLQKPLFPDLMCGHPGYSKVQPYTKTCILAFESWVQLSLHWGEHVVVVFGG